MCAVLQFQCNCFKKQPIWSLQIHVNIINMIKPHFVVMSIVFFLTDYLFPI